MSEHDSAPSDRGLDEAAYWARRGMVRRFRVLPNGDGLSMREDRFKSAHRDGGDLVVEIAAFRYRVRGLTEAGELGPKTFANLSNRRSPRAMQKLR